VQPKRPAAPGDPARGRARIPPPGTLGTGMRRFAEEAISRRHLYYYFSGKDEILLFCQERTLERLLAPRRERARASGALRRATALGDDAHVHCMLDELEGRPPTSSGSSARGDALRCHQRSGTPTSAACAASWPMDEPANSPDRSFARHARDARSLNGPRAGIPRRPQSVPRLPIRYPNISLRGLMRAPRPRAVK